MTVLSYLIADAVVKSQWINRLEVQVDDCSFIFDCRCSCQITMDNRLEVLEAVWKHLMHFAINAELTQFREGLRGVLNSVHLLTCTRLLFSHCCQQHM